MVWKTMRGWIQCLALRWGLKAWEPPQGDSGVFTELPYWNATDSHGDRKQISLFHICHNNMKIILFLKSRIIVAIIIQRIFLFCIFKKIGGRDCYLSIWRQEAQVCETWKHVALCCWHWRKNDRYVSAVCHMPWAPYALGTALILSNFPQGRKIPL